MNQSFNVQFYARASKANKNGYTPLEMSVNINGERKFMSLPYKCLPSDFNRKKQPKELVDYQANMRRRVNEILNTLLEEGQPLSTRTLIEYMKSGGHKSYTVENLFEEYLDILNKRLGKTITKSVYSKYVLVQNLFYTIVNKNSECSTITPSHVKKFKAICESQYKTSTTGGYLQKLKTVLTFALDNGRIKVNPFVGTKITKGSKEIDYLTEEELEKLENLHIENESLQNALNCFLFECYSGISYCDIRKINVEDIRESDGVYYIQGLRQKTGKPFTSVLMPQFTKLADIHEGRVTGLRFRRTALQKVNEYLHTIEALYGLNKRLTTHLGRHTYATLLANKYRCRMEVVADALGDSLRITTKHYAKFLSETTVNEIGGRFKRAE